MPHIFFRNINMSEYKDFETKEIAEVKSSLEKYLVEVSRIPTLSHDEEIALGRRISAAKNEAERKKAIGELVYANLHIVLFHARKYLNRRICLEDLIQEGNLGLMHAAEKFDADMGCRFSTYAAYWIKTYIDRAIFDHWQTVRLPDHIAANLKKYFRVKKFLARRLHREATSAEIAAEMGINEAEADNLGNIFRMNLSESLNAPIPGTDGLSLLDLTEDNSPGQFTEVERIERNEEIGAALAGLNERNKLIVESYFGMALRGRAEENMSRIARHVGLCRDSISKIVPKALEQVRHSLLCARHNKKKPRRVSDGA